MGFKESWSRLSGEFTEAADRPNAYKASSALSTLYASDYEYNEWKDIGIAFKAAGGELEDWLAWCSIDAARYDEAVAMKLYQSVDEVGEITANSLWKRAWDAGWKWHERYESLPKVKMVPEPREFDSADAQAIAQLEAMFEPGDMVNIVTKAGKNAKGKWVPDGYGIQRERDEWCNAIREHGLGTALGGYNVEAGVWLRVNAMDGRGIGDANVRRHANTLVESDDMSLIDQERMLFELNMPIVCVTSSGGKSLHAIVRIDAEGPRHYDDRVRYLHDECLRAGMTIDKADRNPSRLTRLAGVTRGEHEQTLKHLRIGARDFTAWMRADKKARLSFDYGIKPMDLTTPVVLDEVLIDGVMRRGDKMCVAGPSKSYKSFSLIQLALAVACGGKWLGWRCKQGRVLYLNCELRGESFRKRVQDVAAKLDWADPDTVHDNMDSWDMRGFVKPLEVCKDKIIELAGEKPYDVVILDPIYKLFQGDENSAQEVSAFMLAMDELAMRMHASIVYCHHHSKGAKGGISAQDRFSGSGVFARDCDELIDISPLDLKGDSPSRWGFDNGSTAWRIETVIRDFAPKAPVDVVFEYPVHTVDETGYLGDYSILSPQSVGGTKRGEQKKEERDKRMHELEERCAKHYASDERTLTASDLADEFGVSTRTIVSWANKAPTLRVEKIGSTNTVRLNMKGAETS